MHLLQRASGGPADVGMASFVGLVQSADGIRLVSKLQLEAGVRGSGRTDFPLPDRPVLQGLSQVLADWNESSEYDFADRLDLVHHLSRRGTALADLNELELLLERDLSVLGWVCEQPELELRYEEFVQPVERTRRIARGAIDQLMSHSEQWARRSARLPIPRRVLGVVRNDEVDTYENRVARQLTTSLIGYLIERLDEIGKHRAMNELAARIQVDGWHRRRSRIAHALGDNDSATTAQRLAEAAERIERMLDALRALHTSTVFREVPSRTEIRTLHPTNLLRNDSRYRKVAGLWSMWEEHRSDRPTTVDEHIEATRRSSDAMDVFVLLVVCRALLDLEFEPVSANVPDFRGPLGRASILFEDGVTVLRLTGSDGADQTLRFLGVISPLLDLEASDAISRARELHALEPVLAPDEASLVIVHPTPSADIQLLPSREQYFLDHAGTDTIDPADRAIRVPASPLEADALERVGRIVRQHVYEPMLRRYPVGDALSRDQAELLSGFNEEGVELGDLSFRVLQPRPPGLATRMEEAARKEFQRRRSQAVFPDWSNVRAATQAASEFFSELRRCPTQPCDKSGSKTLFEARARSTFICTCGKCGTKWGLQSCGACGEAVPFLLPASRVPTGIRPTNHFGADLLAAPCEIDADRFICPSCRTCPVHSGREGCGRCSEA